MPAAPEAEIRAAGGLVWRRGPAGVEVAVIHRPRYGDWSLPKGKLDPGETWEQAAVREVEEEIGVRCQLGEELGTVEYTDHEGRAKVVRYWLMEAAGPHPEFEPNDEVDALRWMEPGAAVAALSHERDSDIVAEAFREPDE